MIDPSVIAALISGTIAIVGILVSVVTLRWQLGLQKRELELKAQELDSATRQLRTEFEALKQAQFTEVLKKRLDAYPKVWATVTHYTLEWEAEGKVRNHGWAKEFLEQLALCNSEAGVLFSEAVYEKFHQLVSTMIKIDKELVAGGQVSRQELQLPDSIFTGEKGREGLATFLKDDLGSYGNSAIQVRNGESHSSLSLSELRHERFSTSVPVWDRITNRPAADLEAKAYLVAMENIEPQGRVYDIYAGETRIGKSPRYADLVVHRDSKSSPISLLHCRFVINSEGVSISDENSANGTYLNGVRLEPGGSYPVNDGDIIELAKAEHGGAKFSFETESPNEEFVSPPTQALR